MGGVTTSDILITTQNRVHVAGGDVLHGLKVGDIGFSGFEEIYFSYISSGFVKGWKRHTTMTMNLIVPVGEVSFVFFVIDGNGNTSFRIENIGSNCYKRITVPPGIWFGFKGMDAKPSLVTNIANICHDPNEVERLSLLDLFFDWGGL